MGGGGGGGGGLCQLTVPSSTHNAATIAPTTITTNVACTGTRSFLLHPKKNMNGMEKCGTAQHQNINTEWH